MAALHLRCRRAIEHRPSALRPFAARLPRAASRTLHRRAQNKWPSSDVDCHLTQPRRDHARCCVGNGITPQSAGLCPASRRSADRKTRFFCAQREAVHGRYCCKSPKMRGTIFPAKRQNKPQSPIDIASSPSPKSPESLSPDDVAPHMFIPTSRLQPRNFVINDAKRLLQQYRP
jgi:hypothetical protein